jgi:hypothetical protein
MIPPLFGKQEVGIWRVQKRFPRHNIVLSKPCLSGIRTHNVSGDSCWLHRHYHTITTMTALVYYQVYNMTCNSKGTLRPMAGMPRFVYLCVISRMTYSFVYFYSSEKMFMNCVIVWSFWYNTVIRQLRTTIRSRPWLPWYIIKFIIWHVILKVPKIDWSWTA